MPRPCVPAAGGRTLLRPEILNPLFAEITTLKGVGPRNAKAFARLAGDRVVDLIFHLPWTVIDRSHEPAVADAPDDGVATFTVTVQEHRPPATQRSPHRVLCSDGTGTLELVFFHAKGDSIGRQLPPAEARIVSGRVTHYQGRAQIQHPEYILTPEERYKLPAVEPVYPLTAGLTNKQVRAALRGALARTPALPEWLDPALQQREGWPGWREAIEAVHAPDAPGDLEPDTPARRRLAYDEFLANQLALALVRRQQRRLTGRSIQGDGTLRAQALAAVPFSLTASQDAAIRDILADMAEEHRMLRLLQGDVGSGKTVVAVHAMLTAVEAGCQAAVMAPTEVLARQHFATIEPLARAAGVETLLLTGKQNKREREATLARLADGRAGVVVGTHALFQQDVAFNDLALAVIDEQHRFGVHQRMSLQAKGRGVDVLVMTATPIPRTLLLTAYGDMEATRITEKPAGRQPVDTRTVPLDRLEEVVHGVARAIGQGSKVFWVCPLVDESRRSDVAAAEARYADLRERFGERVGLVHGRMTSSEKDRVMTAFRDGGVDVLVATTVIEVGVDVPAATLMVIEHAERFGLAQLHQLRGRIGRGQQKAACVLLYQGPLGETARGRLRILRETDDGFRIAEEDMRLRGSGEVLGTRQSGFPEFRVADPAAHEDLLAAARDDAALILHRDAELQSERGRALRVLLYLFERDAAVRYLRSG